MRLFFDYLNLRRRTFSVFLVFCAVFALLFALYELPLEAVLYPMAICFFLGLLFVLNGFARYKKQHLLLEHIQREIGISLEHLPAPHSALDADYQAIIRTLYQDKQRITDEMNRQYTDLVDYYTVWVHQIKTPISAMKLMLQADHSAQGRELHEELQRIEQYVEMVLCYLRLDAGSTDYVIKEYDLDEIIKQAVRKFASQFIRKRIRLNYEPVNCHVLTDEKWLLFVVEQLLSNALKYTKSGSITISLESPKTLVIADTGIGIAPEDLPRIFDSGYTGYNGRSDKKASGIGLHLCKRICSNLNHRISATSAVDNGTVIKIALDHAPLMVE